MSKNVRATEYRLFLTSIIGAMVGIDPSGAMSQEAQQSAAAQALPEVTVVQSSTLALPPKRKLRSTAKKSPSGLSPPPTQASAKPVVEADSEASETPVVSPSIEEGSAENLAVSTVDGIAIDQIGTSATVVTGAQLRAQQTNSVADALRSLPGVAVNQTGAEGGLTQVRIRGAEPNHTLVLIDGVEVNDTTNGEFDFSDLATDDIEQIEVLRGPQSGLYGTGALGGVINIVTKGGHGPLTFRGTVEGGSFGTRNVSAGASAGSDTGYFKFGVHRKETSGFNISPLGAEDDATRMTSFNFNAGVAITPDAGIDLVLRRTEKFGDRDGFGGPAGALATSFNDASTFSSATWLAGVNVHWDMFDKALTHVVRANHYSNDLVDIDRSLFPFHSDNNSERDQYGYLLTYRFATPEILQAAHSLSGLAERQEERFTPSSDFADGLERSRNRLATVAEYRGEFGDRMFVTGSVRNDNNSDVEDFTTWRTTATLKLPEVGLRPHGSAGTGVKLPSFFELAGFIPGFFVPNPNLKPEESFGWDAGVEFSFGNGAALLDVTYFRANLENEIVSTGFPFSVANLAGESEREGIEIAGRYKFTPDLVFGTSYTYLDATEPDGQLEIRRPRHTGRADITYTFDAGRGTINLAAIYNGQMQDLVFRMPFFTSERLTLDDYWLVQAAASYKVAQGVELFGRVENLLDEDHQEVFGYETAGIAAYAGLRFKYEEEQTRAWSEGQ